MKAVDLNNNLVLLEVPVTAHAAPPASQGKNNIWIYDRSGSMYYELSHVVADMIERVSKLAEGDTLTVAWFSGEGDFGYVVKGYRILGPEDREAICKMLANNAEALNTTCFSEVLSDMRQVIDDLSAINPNFHLMFFTDGYPVVSNYHRELMNIHAAIAAIKPDLNSALLVGYGDYYNRDLMTDMAERIGGSLVHSSKLEMWSLAFERFVSHADSVQRRVVIELPHVPGEALALFTIQGNQITLLSCDRPGEVLYAPTGQGDAVYMVYRTNPNLTEAHRLPHGAEWSDIAAFEREAYAAAAVLSQKAKADAALEVLGALGDVDLIDRINNAYTNDDLAKAEERITLAAFTPSHRYVRGKNTNYLPSPYAFCVLDALETLAADPEARFHPQHESFDYKRIGRPAFPREGYPRFNPEPGASSPFAGLTWHDERLNLSIKTVIPGTVRLKDGYREHGFGSTYRCVRFRDYAIIADAALNVRKLPASMSEATFERLKIAGIIDETVYEAGRVYVVHLDRLPLVNRAAAIGRTSAAELCRLELTDIKLAGKLKAFNKLRDELDPDKTLARSTTLTPEQEAFLKENGIDANGRYSPPTDPAPTTDVLYVKHFRLKAKGLSSLPSVNEVRKRMESGKAITPSQALVLAGLAAFEQEAPKTSVRDQLAWLDERISELNGLRRGIRSQVQRTKMGIALGKKWFDEFDSRDENKIDVEGVQFTIELEEKPVAI